MDYSKEKSQEIQKLLIMLPIQNFNGATISKNVSTIYSLKIKVSFIQSMEKSSLNIGVNHQRHKLKITESSQGALVMVQVL